MLTQLSALTFRALLLLSAIAVAGCAGRPAATTAPAPVGEYPPIAVPVSATRYEIDPAQTKVTVLVRRAGPLARLGHNHAIVSGDERGVIWIGSTLQASGFEIHVPVRSFVVDDPDARAAAGPEFTGTVPDEARAGTAANMLRAEVLDAGQYPEIVVRGDSATGSWQQAVVHATVRVKDMPREFDVTVALSVSDGVVEASGAFQTRQTDFGITPFSVAGGAVQVADPVDVTFRIRGVRH